ncbi:MAG: hypothetical protein OEM46_04445 [Ignavibacteria bacterium]|nr:hypothetical protein [Ignavibacteria bacterium]
MKRIIILAVVLFSAVTFNVEAKKHYNGVGGYFYSQLSPYGSWIEVDYGVIVWRPTIIRVNWSPYQMGRWVWTYDGWYWDSYEPFGFITYHYGRWYYDDYYGWLWYPDYEWAPAWVEWRYDNNYIGWAPLHPYAVFSVSVGIFFTHTYYTPYHHWNYVGYGNFCDPYVYNYYVARGYKYRIHSGTKYRNNFVYYNGRIQNRGVDVKYVSVRSGQKIKQRDLVRVSDSRDLNRDGNGKNKRDEIRTLDLKRDELIRNDLGRMEIKRENRKTSVDMEKVKIGRREDVTNVKKNDQVKNRTLDGLKTDQNRKDVKVLQKNRTETNKKSDGNVNRKENTREVSKRETGKTINSNSRDSKNDTRKISQTKVSKNETSKLNRKNQEQNTQVKRENTRVTNNTQMKRNEVKERSRNDNQQNKSSEKKVKTDRTKEKDNSRERSKR